MKINDEDLGIPIDLLSIPVHYREHLDNVLIPSGLIHDRWEFISNTKSN